MQGKWTDRLLANRGRVDPTSDNRIELAMAHNFFWAQFIRLFLRIGLDNSTLSEKVLVIISRYLRPVLGTQFGIVQYYTYRFEEIKYYVT